MKDDYETPGKAVRRPGKVPSGQSQLPPMLYKAIQAHLTSRRKTLTMGGDGVLHLEDNEAITAKEVIDLAWRDGFIRIAKDGDLLLLHADRVSFATDMPKVRRRLEENIRNVWEVGTILEVALRVGVSLG